MTLRTQLSMSSPHSAARVARPLGAALLLGIVLLGASMTDQVALAQKGGKTPPPPPVTVLPTVRYELTWLDGGPDLEAVFPRDINRWGDVTGFANGVQTAFAYSSDSGETFNLNDLDALWWDLNAAEPTGAGGWWAYTAFGINDDGDIVGGATNDNPNLPDRAFVLVNAFGPDEPYFLLLPTWGTGDEYGRRINNYGEAVGHAVGLGVIRYRPIGDHWPYYEAVLEIADPAVDGIMDINDDGYIVARTSGGSYRQLVAGTVPPPFFAGHEFWSISNGGQGAMISGLRHKGGKNGPAGGSIRLPVMASVAQLIYPGGSYARAINDNGDVVFEAGRGFLYTDATKTITINGIPTQVRYGTNGNGVVPLDSLVVTDGWLDTSARLDGINNRVGDNPDSDGFGHICGYDYGSSRGFLLTPIGPAH